MIFLILFCSCYSTYRIKNELQIYVTNDRLPYQLRGTYDRVPRVRPITYENRNGKILLKYEPVQRLWLVQAKSINESEVIPFATFDCPHRQLHMHSLHTKFSVIELGTNYSTSVLIGHHDSRRAPKSLFIHAKHDEIYGLYFAVRKNVFIRADNRHSENFDTVFYRNFPDEPKWTIYRNFPRVTGRFDHWFSTKDWGDSYDQVFIASTLSSQKETPPLSDCFIYSNGMWLSCAPQFKILNVPNRLVTEWETEDRINVQKYNLRIVRDPTTVIYRSFD